MPCKNQRSCRVGMPASVGPGPMGLFGANARGTPTHAQRARCGPQSSRAPPGQGLDHGMGWRCLRRQGHQPYQRLGRSTRTPTRPPPAGAGLPATAAGPGSTGGCPAPSGAAAAQQPGGPQAGIGDLGPGGAGPKRWQPTALPLRACNRPTQRQGLAGGLPALHAFGPVVCHQSHALHLLWPQAGRQALHPLVPAFAAGIVLRAAPVTPCGGSRLALA